MIILDVVIILMCVFVLLVFFVLPVLLFLGFYLEHCQHGRKRKKK